MRQKGNKGRVKKEKYSPLLHQDHDSNAYAATRECHGRVGTLIFILSYLRACDPERILLYIDRGTFVF